MSSADPQQRWLAIEPKVADEPPGLQRFTVPEQFDRCPRTRFEGSVRKRGPGYDWFIGLRIVVGGTPRAWMLVDDWWSWTYVAVTDSEDGAGVIDHIRSGDVESDPDWTSWFRERLLGENTPLYPGLWQIYPLPQQPRRHRLRGRWYVAHPPRHEVPVPWPNAFETQAFDEVVPIRTASRADDGRVKWWRKLARQDKLPPVLLMYCAPLLGWVVLDGHDRLLAAALEDVEPTFVGLSPLRRRELGTDPGARAVIEQALNRQLEEKPDDPRTIDGVNRTLVALYEDHYVELRQRVWPLRGGSDTWLSEVSSLTGSGDSASDVLTDMREFPDS